MNTTRPVQQMPIYALSLEQCRLKEQPDRADRLKEVTEEIERRTAYAQALAEEVENLG